MRGITAAIVISAVLAMLGAGSVSAFPATPTVWFVDDDGLAGSNGCNGNQSVPTDIQSAVNAAAPYDTVKVCPGIYVGTVAVSRQGLTLTATAPWVATIKAPESMSGPLVNLDNASDMTLRWFNIVAATTNPCSTPDSLLQLNYAPQTDVRANHFGIDGPESTTDCRSFIDGIDLNNSPRSFIGGNEITDFSGVGIFELNSNDTHIRGNTVKFLHASLPCCYYSDSVGIIATSFGTVVRGNKIRTLPTAGDTTPVLQVGINLFGQNSYAWQNVIRYANYGIQTIHSTNVTIRANRLRAIRYDGIILAFADGAIVQDNRVHAGIQGIHVGNSSSGNSIFGNDFRGVSDPDCLDSTSGSGTSSTANSWTDNLGNESSPSGICAPAP